jgi:hypothetical protein
MGWQANYERRGALLHAGDGGRFLRASSVGGGGACRGAQRHGGATILGVGDGWEVTGVTIHSGTLLPKGNADEWFY